MAAEVTILDPGAAGDYFVQLTAEDVANAKTVNVRFSIPGGFTADPANGSRLLIRIDVKNSSV